MKAIMLHIMRISNQNNVKKQKNTCFSKKATENRNIAFDMFCIQTKKRIFARQNDKISYIMTQEEYFSIDWKRGNMVRLTNGKEYMVRAVKKKCLLLHSDEHYAYFVVDHRIIDCRTSDAVEQKKEEQPYQYKPRPQYGRQQNNRYQRPQHGNNRYRNNSGSYRNNKYNGGNTYRSNRYAGNQYGDNPYRSNQYGNRGYQREQNGYGNGTYDSYRYERRWNSNGNATPEEGNAPALEQRTDYRQAGYQPAGYQQPMAAQQVSPDATGMQPITAPETANNPAEASDEQAPMKRKRQRMVIRKVTAEKVEYRPRNYSADTEQEQQ